jgi:lipopolysaccharide export system permease protein
LKMATLLYDVRQKKPAFDIKEQVFYKGIDNYAIRVGKKGKDGQTIYDVMIYDHSRNNGNTRVVKAESGKMQMTDDELFLILTLYNGTSYEEAEAKDDNKKKKENTYPFFRSKFKEHITRLDLSSFSMQKTDEELFKDNYQMLNIKQINREVDTIKAELTENYIDFQKQMNEKTLLFADSVQIEKVSGTKKFDSELFKGYKKEEITKLLDFADNYTRNSRSYTITTGTGIESKEYSIIRYIVEWHRKFTLSVACIVLFFIGAPLGAIIRKGGLGMPVVVSVIFFLVFHTLSITGEKLAKQGELEPGYGMWLATVILAPIGVFLTYKATTDSVLLDTDFYYKLIRPAIGIFKKKKE